VRQISVETCTIMADGATGRIREGEDDDDREAEVME
jgi:hypothetical protein